MNSLKKQSRIAAALYLLNGLPAPFALLYVPSVLIVRGDAAATANNVRDSELLLRLGMAGELFSSTIVIFAMLAFYHLFKAVSQKHAMAMMILMLISVPISYLNVLNDLAALTFARGPEFLSAVFDKAQLDAFVLFFLRLHNQGFILAQIFWGLWLFPFGIAVMRSGFIPRFVGIATIIAGCGYVISSSVALFLPPSAQRIGDLAMILGAGELAFFWLLIWGAKEQHPDPAPVIFNQMITNKIDSSQRTAAKVAGIAGVLAFALVVFGNYVLLGPLIVPHNATDTARNILAHQTQFRVALTCFIAYGIGVIVLLTALYVILAPVNRGLALAGALFRLVFAMLWLIAPVNSLAALRLLGDASYLKVFEPDRLQALARVQIAGSFDDYYVGLPFFGLAATVCAWLWLKSKYIPRGLSIFGVIGSAWCVFCAFVYLIFPNFNKIVNDYIFDSPMALFELAVSVWLLVKGLKSVEPNQTQAGVA